MAPALLPLNAWSNFYIIVGSAAAGLTGLTFVVIALAAEMHTIRYSGLRAFMTPTVVHFGSVLWIAALLNVPGQTPASVAVCMASSGLAGVVYCLLTAHRMHRGRGDYRPFVSDWIWNAALPFMTYLALAMTGAQTYRHPATGLYGIGASALLLLIVGIHNVWDIAVWITAKPATATKPRDGQHAADPAASAARERDAGN